MIGWNIREGYLDSLGVNFPHHANSRDQVAVSGQNQPYVISVFSGKTDKIHSKEHINALFAEMTMFVPLEPSQAELPLAMSAYGFKEPLLPCVAAFLLFRGPLRDWSSV